jgi:hypothetical protein
MLSGVEIHLSIVSRMLADTGHLVTSFFVRKVKRCCVCRYWRFVAIACGNQVEDRSYPKRE